jgi:hypothetical protein
MKSHGLITAIEVEDFELSASDITLPRPEIWIHVLPHFGHHFIMLIDKPKVFDGHQQFFAIVQLIGTRKQAENFAYRLGLKNQGRCVTWEATTRSIHEGVPSAIMNSDCLVLNACTAQHFADKGKLFINVSISVV